ncbi:hypothetical protein [Tissierella praeacuta]|uniref:hypothetical protein n=1 Tax=Tissierella praeacuta TaxID=43131 RepID=UPI001A9FB4E5|nr:hypothetical protein [Tissierella praeacuta]
MVLKQIGNLPANSEYHYLKFDKNTFSIPLKFHEVKLVHFPEVCFAKYIVLLMLPAFVKFHKNST